MKIGGRTAASPGVRLLLILVCVGCSVAPGELASGQPSITPGPAVQSSGRPSTLPNVGLGGRPVDSTIEPVSASAISAEAQLVLDLCTVSVGQLDVISGMGLVPSARDVQRYVRLTGLEPELMMDRPAWVIAFQGDLAQLMSQEVWVDATCVVIEGVAGFYATGGVREAGSDTLRPPPAVVQREPDLALPALVR